MSRASAIALRLWERHDLAVPVDLKGLASALGIEVVSFPFRGRLEEVIIDRTIGVRSGLDRRWFRWRVAHGIGHHQLHTGVRARVGGCAGCDGKAERQAGRESGGLSGTRLDLTYRAKSRTDSHSSSVRSPISVSRASWWSSMGLSYSWREM